MPHVSWVHCEKRLVSLPPIKISVQPFEGMSQIHKCTSKYLLSKIHFLDSLQPYLNWFNTLLSSYDAGSCWCVLGEDGYGNVSRHVSTSTQVHMVELRISYLTLCNPLDLNTSIFRETGHPLHQAGMVVVVRTIWPQQHSRNIKRSMTPLLKYESHIRHKALIAGITIWKKNQQTDYRRKKVDSDQEIIAWKQVTVWKHRYSWVKSGIPMVWCRMRLVP